MARKQPKIKVMLADDHAVVRSGIRLFLEDTLDIQVVAEAEDGAEARALIEQLQPDVAILDIQMPHSSGIEVTRWLRTNYPHIGVLVLTSYDDDPYVTAVLQAGANGFILKTASPEDIVKAVRDVHEGASVLDPAVAHKLLLQIARRQEEQGPTYESLTERERDVITLVAKGHTNKAIGVQLGISDRTVQGHLAHIFGKLQAGSRTEAVMKAVSLGWLPADIVDL
ncbi:MAG: response regulator transcription factor [Chloroflexi bacterium]|nr:response regulator transcription factor [Chloroflexota bacterium]